MEKGKYTSLSEGSVMGVLIRFALPFLLSGMLQMAYSTVDVYFLGRFSTAAAVAGTSQGLQINAVLTSLFLGITNGGTILLGQYTGAKDWKNAARTLGNVILIAAASVIIATVVLVAGHDALLTVMKVPPEAFGEARNYLLVCCCGLSFIMGYNVVSSVLRSLGNSRAPFFFILISTSMNVALDYVCVVRLSWGAFGAALATVISQAASFIIALIYIRSRGLPFAFGFKNISPNKDIILQIMKLGIPMSLQSAVNNFSFMVVGRLINSMGVYASAANSVVGTITGICMMIPLSVSMSVSAITAQNIGAGKADRAVKTLRYGIILCLCFAIPFALICDFFPGDVIRLLNSDAGVVRESILYLYPYSWDCVFVCFVFCFNGFFNGCGKTLFAMLQESISAFAVRFPAAYLFKMLLPGANMFHVGLSTPLASFASLIACVIYYKVGFSRQALENMYIGGEREETAEAALTDAGDQAGL